MEREEHLNLNSVVSFNECNNGATVNIEQTIEPQPQLNSDSASNIEDVITQQTQDINKVFCFDENGKLTVLSNISEIKNIDNGLRELLESWELPEDILKILSKQVNLEVLRCMEYGDIKDLFMDHRTYGSKILFRTKLINWRNETKNPMITPSAETRSMDSRTETWIRENIGPSPSVTTSTVSSKILDREITDDIQTILNKSIKGRIVLKFFKKRQFLSLERRKDLIHALTRKRRLKSHDYDNIVKSIVNVFPTELSTMYYKPRTGKGNFDEQKLWLETKLRPWEPVLDYWKATSLKRIAYFKTAKDSTITRFFSEWPRYKDEGGDQLFDIDFHVMFPEKNDGLLKFF